MSISMFVTGFVIFSIYLAILIWNIYGHKAEKKDRPLERQADQLDMDGMGNFSRFPAAKED